MADTRTTINCPACGTQMKKIFIPETGIHVDICLDGCGGIYFDNREFKAFDEQAELLNEVILEAESSTFNINIDRDALRICPGCGAKMVKNPTSIKGGIIIDDCYTCGGKFLDHGELTKIRAEYATEKERSEAAIQALLSSPAGAELGISSASARVNAKMAKINNSLLGKLLNKLMD